MVTTDNEYKLCRVIPCGSTEEKEVAFCEIQEGDTIFIGGMPLKVTYESHYSGDATYDGYLLYAEDEEGLYPEDGYFPEDLDEASARA